MKDFGALRIEPMSATPPTAPLPPSDHLIKSLGKPAAHLGKKRASFLPACPGRAMLIVARSSQDLSDERGVTPMISDTIEFRQDNVLIRPH
jgi:hypothetical protein